MAKRRESGIDVVASMPWLAGIVLGLLAFVGIRYGIGWCFASSTNPFTAALGKAGARGAYAPIAWVLLFGCWLGSLLSFLKQRRRNQLLETRTGLDSIRAMSWQAFEVLVGEAFRRQGYAVEETGLGGADGGIDLVLRKQGQIILVQCKQWRTRQVSVKVVREMFGLLAHHAANAVIVVSIGDYTADARQFIQGKPIELINGEQLLSMVRAVQTPAETIRNNSRFPKEPTASPMPAEPSPDDAPSCPTCETTMVRRANRRTRDAFWGCPSYPRCRGTRTIAAS